MKCIKLLEGGAYRYSGSGVPIFHRAPPLAGSGAAPPLFPVVHGGLENRVVSP